MSRKSSVNSLVEDMDQSRSSTPSLTHSNSDFIERGNQDFNEAGLIERTPRAMNMWTAALWGCLTCQCRRLSHYLSGEIEPLLSAWSDPPKKYTEKALDITTNILALLGLVTVSAGVLGVCVVGDVFENVAPELESLAGYIVPAGAFIYSFIFSLDRRPPQLVQLFLDMAEVRASSLKSRIPGGFVKI